MMTGTKQLRPASFHARTGTSRASSYATDLVIASFFYSRQVDERAEDQDGDRDD